MNNSTHKEQSYILHPSVFYRTINDKTVLYYTAAGLIYTFNSSAADLFRLFEKVNSVTDAVKHLKDYYEIADSDENFDERIRAFFSELLKDGIVVPTSRSGDYSGNLENEISNEFAENNRLYSATIELTYRCNEKCRHCYVYDETGEELSTKELKRVLDELREMGVLSILFTGGEPFARDDIFEILEHAYNKNFAIDIFTNGTLLNSDGVLKLKAIWPKCVHFSVYSHIPEKHDAVTRINGSFQNTIEAIKKCRLVGIPVKIKMPVFDETANDVPGVISLAKELGASIGISSDITPKKNGDTTPLIMRTLSKEHNELISKTIDEMIDDLYRPEQNGKKHGNRICSAGARMLSINPYGKVFPCVSFPISVGDVRSQDMRDIWSNSKELEEWRQANHIENRVDCIKCEHFEYCRFCPGEAIHYNGNPLSKYEDACLVSSNKTTINQ